MKKEKQIIDEMSYEIQNAVNGCSSYWSGLIAEALYTAGYRKQSENTIELPCKVGDILYRIEANHIEDDSYLIYEFMVDKEYVSSGNISIFAHRIWNGKVSTSYERFTNFDIGKTVFLSRDEAEKALAERSNNDKT